jgi:poly [ADP-ribose] polymerase
MFGSGIYFADKYQKSRGYTSLTGSYWASGSSKQAFMALYEVNTGMEYRIQQHTSECYSMNYDNLKKKGDFDSLFAKGGIDLRNNEYIVYKEEQCTIKYLIEIGE